MASREERELQDVERAMEEELVAEHMQVERVIHLRLEHFEGQQQFKYLVKVCTSLLNMQPVSAFVCLLLTPLGSSPSTVLRYAAA